MQSSDARPCGSECNAELGQLPRVPACPFAVFDEFGNGADDRVQDYAAALVAAERERCSKPVPDEWLVKVRRLVQGFEHVSGIARLWEPDYSSGSDRALWAQATEACADVAKLLRDVEGPNARANRTDTAR